MPGTIPTALAAIGDVKINDFNATVTSGPIPLQVHFTGNVSGPVTGWHWKFINEGTGEIHYSTENVTAFHIFESQAYLMYSCMFGELVGNSAMKKTAYILPLLLNSFSLF